MAVLRAQSDARLAELTASGSERAFEAIVQRYRGPLVRHCRRLLRDREAEDVVQAALLRAWTALRTGEHVRELRPWLFTIARNGALDVIRRSGYDYDELRESISGVGGPDEEIERRAVVRRTLTGLASLPPAQREALLRVAVDGQSQAQAAEELGLTEGAVRQLVYRARAGLRAAAGAFVPLPIISWAAALGAGSPTVERIAQIAAASAPAAPAAIKAGALLATAAVATAPVAVHHAARDRDGAGRPGSSAVVTRAPAASQAPAPASPVALGMPVRRPGSAGEDEDRSGRDDADRDAAGEREQHGRSRADEDRDETRHSATGRDDHSERESGGEDSREERSGTEEPRESASPATNDDDGHSGESGTPGHEAPEAGGESEAPAPAAAAPAERSSEPDEPADAGGEPVHD